MADNFTWWRKQLAGAKLPVHADDPQPGFYKKRDGKDGPWLPVCIWTKDGKLIARVGSEVADPHEIWTWVAENPVAQADAKYAFSHGKWPGDIPDIGHNSGDLSLREEIEDAAQTALTWLDENGISDQKSCDMAANYRKRLLDLGKKADLERKEQKQPHLDASRAVDAEFNPIIQSAKDAAETIRSALTTWMRKQEAIERKRVQEEERKAREKAEAERQAAIKEAEATGKAPEVVELPTESEPIKAKPIQAGGQRGRKTGLRTLKRAVITDYDKALAHFASHDKVVALIEQLAQHAARDGHPVPGVEVREEKVAA